MRRSLLVSGVVALAMALVVPASGASAPTMTDRVRGAFEEAAARNAIDVEMLFSMPAELSVSGVDGSVRTETMPLGDVIDLMVPQTEAPLASERSGPAGTPEYLAGNTTHIFAHLYVGSTSGADCRELTRTESAVVPSVPFVPVTGAPLYLTPVPGALSPVIPASSWALPAYVAGGTVKHIKGSYNLFGLHTVGTLIGSSASTAEGAPAPYPVWAPMTTFGFVGDNAIDFVGHAQDFQAPFRFDFFGLTICGNLGGLLLSDGFAIFDNHEIADGVLVELPDVP